MDIRNWPMDRIMQLPDGCFGRRWPVIAGGVTEGFTDRYYIVETGVPDRGVVWEIIITSQAAAINTVLFELAWGDQAPADAAAWTALQKMFPCQGIQDGADRGIACCGPGPWHLTKLRLPSPASGLRPVLRLDGAATAEILVCATLVISSIPNEVPDCLLSV